uniref:Uncharacterized protein n=1 Tax=Siphoviridae sp. ctWWc42 TaxID=2826361 RepID=A0A8S5R2F1_9CAUD|nr:MAG TPA: hypothetical protein [Siphoviridae sp. ctWWc42]
MDRIYWDANDKYAIGWILYGKKADNKIYLDAGCTKQATSSEVEMAFKKRIVVSYDGGLYAPISCVTTSGITKISILLAGASDAVTMTGLSSVKDA